MKVLVAPTVKVLVALCGTAGLASASLGDRFEMNHFVWAAQPLDVAGAKANGFLPVGGGDCGKGLGIAYAKDGMPSVNHSTTLYYTAGGQFSGYGIDVFGPETPALKKMIALGYYERKAAGWHLALGFREGDVCDPKATFAEPVGTGVVINPRTQAKHVPLTAKGAAKDLYHEGACIEGMGTHWVKDLKSKPEISWVGGAVEPVVPMYHAETGELRSIFVTSPSAEAIVAGNGWEGFPLPNEAMCWNFCEKDCPFTGTVEWRVSHMYFKDHAEASCPADWTCLDSPPAPAPGIKCCANGYTPTEAELRRMLGYKQ